MHSESVVAVALLAVVLAISATGIQAAPSPPPLCEPSVIEEMPAHIKKVCLALENSNQLSNALTAYLIHNEANLMFRPDDLVGPGTGKRTDVDHVFLRFGRRR